MVLNGSQQAVPGPSEHNGAVQTGPGSYYSLTHGIPLPEGANRINEYSLQFDFRIPENGAWRCFFQTSPDNTGDGDFFINPGGDLGVAAVGYSGITITPGEWYRLIISVKNGTHFTTYLDGKLLLNGSVQPLNGRFSLGPRLLVFADDNGEDGILECAELAIWGQALSAEEASAAGGYPHSNMVKVRLPFLQSPGSSSMTICWHDTTGALPTVNYGTEPGTLPFAASGTAEQTGSLYWHTVKLTALNPDTHYYYQIAGGNEEPPVYGFRTVPGETFSGKIRFLLLSDTHTPDTVMTGKVARQAVSTISGLYGKDLENHITAILHSGDIVMDGNSAWQYDKLFFQPLSSLTARIPTLLVAGNHEAESPFFYQYLKADEISAYPGVPGLNEKILQFRAGNSLILGLNTNISDQYGTTQANWLKIKLEEAEKDSTIDFVFLFFHHPPFSELWNYVNTSDAGSAYVREVLLPVIRKCGKVRQLHYGHTHGYERGALLSDRQEGDFRIVCGGGSGGNLDPWAPGANTDLDEITTCISNYIFQILEIDIAEASCFTSVYSLGTLAKPLAGEKADTYYFRRNQPPPATPAIESANAGDGFIRIFTSRFHGSDSLMTLRLQIAVDEQFARVVLDTFIHRVNIYGTGPGSQPLDLNKEIRMEEISIPDRLLPSGSFSIRIRHRDNNLRWSGWSEPWTHKATGMETKPMKNSLLLQNYPNPFNRQTRIDYTMKSAGHVTFRIFDMNKKLLFEKPEGVRLAGNHSFLFSGERLPAGMYICELETGTQQGILTLIKR